MVNAAVCKTVMRRFDPGLRLNKKAKAFLFGVGAISNKNCLLRDRKPFEHTIELCEILSKRCTDPVGIVSGLRLNESLEAFELNSFSEKKKINL